MFLGHFALGFAAKKIAPKESLGTLFAASQWLDLLWPVFLILGMEHVRVSPGVTKVSPFDFYDYPLSHSLVMVAAWAAGWGLVYLILGKNNKTAWVMAVLVVSHWVLDLIVHRPDLPLLPNGGPVWGLGLWNSQFGTIALEGALFVFGFEFYLLTTKPKDKIGQYGLWALAAVLVLVYIGSLVGKPPINPLVVAWVSMSQWLFILWAYWVDQHRKPA
jgi:hypothetical protein